MKRSTALSILLPLLVISSCLEDKSPVIPSTPLSPEEQVIANCYMVQQALEAFALENNGGYPNGTWEQTPSGNSLYDFLPSGLRLENPFTKVRSEPVDGTATTPGNTGYSPIVGGLNVVGYIVTGFGADAQIIELLKLP